MNESRFLFVLDMIVLNLLDEGRRTYSLYIICVLSLIIVLTLRSTGFSYKAVREECLKPVILLLIFTLCVTIFYSKSSLLVRPHSSCLHTCPVHRSLLSATIIVSAEFLFSVSSLVPVSLLLARFIVVRVCRMQRRPPSVAPSGMLQWNTLQSLSSLAVTML